MVPGAVARRATYINPLERLAFASLLVFLFLLHSRVLDLTISSLHIPILTLYSAAIAAFLGGGFLRALLHRVGFALVAFTFWMMLAVPFSVWPGGAAHVVEGWLKALLVYIVVVGLVTDFDQLRQAIRVLAYSILVLAVLALLFGDMSTGRLLLDRGRFSNPNDLAQILLMGLPFWWHIATSPSTKPSRRKWALAAMAPIAAAMAKTGSRGALIAAVAVGLVWFWRSSISQKVLLTVGALTVVTLAALLLPQSLKERYFTFVAPDEPSLGATKLAPLGGDVQDEMEESAVSSTYGRWALLKDSIILTGLHPIFGVGPGQFEVGQDIYSWAVRKHKGAWQVTHNTFTEVSSECGIPALLLYLTVIWLAFRARRGPRPTWPARKLLPALAELGSVSLCLRLSLLSFTISAVFASFAYQTQLLVLAGLAAAYSRVAQAETGGIRCAG